MIYSFDTNHAQRYGLDEAVILHNVLYWLSFNMANKSHIHDGKVWTYSTAKAYEQLFPFWNRRKIARLLNSLEQQGAIESNNYNQKPYDKTKWYSSPLLDSYVKNDQSNGQKCPIEWSEMTNRMVKTVQPIPDSNTDSNTNSNSSRAVKEKLPPIPYEEFLNIWNATELKPIYRWTEKRREAIMARWSDEYFRENWKVAIATSASSPFLCGKAQSSKGGREPFHMDVEWFIKNDNNFTKIMEGKYGEVQSNEKLLSENDLLAMHPGKTLVQILNPDL